MLKHNFVDHVQIYCSSGKGGDGCRSFRREKYVPHGGPDGGDGGRGGSIVLRANQQLWTLLDLKYRKFIHAKAGQAGMGARRSGKDAPDEILEVPLGTVAKNAETGDILGELKQHGEELTALPGGKGGSGNWHFRSSQNQTPEYARPGQEGLQVKLELELKMLADVGLVGLPNAGKSTLLASISAARPKVADYPFTTEVPYPGIVQAAEFKSFMMADLPGIIEGAAEGKGLGHRFLRHIERNAVLLFLVPADSEDIAATYRLLDRELTAYDETLAFKPRILAVTKADLLDHEMMEMLRADLPEAVESLFLSSVSGYGLQQLSSRLMELVEAERMPGPDNSASSTLPSPNASSAASSPPG
jgi:GTP-binding protein